jgi:membrane protease YdiL (CAAX protease family)
VTALVLATRRLPRVRPPAVAAGLAALGVLAGFASFPVWIGAVGALGGALGLPVLRPPPRPENPLVLFSLLALAPVYEEMIYRERVLPALRDRLGPSIALLLSSLLFALPHLEPWALLTTGLVGLALGALMLAGDSVALCIGVHAGLNLGAVLCGIPPTRYTLSPLLALACSVLLGVAALRLARGRRSVRIGADAH